MSVVVITGLHTVASLTRLSGLVFAGSFKGFALLRQATRPANGRNGDPAFTEPRPVYAPGQVAYAVILPKMLHSCRL